MYDSKVSYLHIFSYFHQVSELFTFSLNFPMFSLFHLSVHLLWNHLCNGFGSTTYLFFKQVKWMQFHSNTLNMWIWHQFCIRISSYNSTPCSTFSSETIENATLGFQAVGSAFYIISCWQRSLYLFCNFGKLATTCCENMSDCANHICWQQFDIEL